MKTARGTSLVELLVASTILITSMVGIFQLLLAGSSAQSRGNQQVSSVMFAQQALTTFTAQGYDGIRVMGAGTYDAGPMYDSAGRRYGRVVTVTDTTTSQSFPSFDITVRVESGRAGGGVNVTTARSVVSYSDGGS